MGRDGGVQQLELLGLVTLHIGDEKWGRVRVLLDNQDIRGVQLQTHPNVDKELFKLRSQVCVSLLFVNIRKIFLLEILRTKNFNICFHGRSVLKLNHK